MRPFAAPNGSWPALLASIRVPAIPAAAQISAEQMAALVEQIQSATHDAEQLVLGRSPVDLTSRLDASSWSVSECFDHLAQTTRAFLPAISDAIIAAPSLAANRPLRTGTLARLFIRNLEPPYRLRFKALPRLAPQRRDFEAARDDFMESQSQLLRTVRSATGLAIDKVKIKSPVYARISYNAYGALRILAAHQHRHVWQIEQILQALDRGQARDRLA
jgi:DinB superfamily